MPWLHEVEPPPTPHKCGTPVNWNATPPNPVGSFWRCPECDAIWEIRRDLLFRGTGGWYWHNVRKWRARRIAEHYGCS